MDPEVRMDNFERRMDMLAQATRTSMKLLTKTQRDIHGLEKGMLEVHDGMREFHDGMREIKDRMREMQDGVGTMQTGINALIAAQALTEDKLQRLEIKIDRFIDSMGPGRKNGHSH